MTKKLVSEQEIVDWINNRLKEEFDGDFSVNHIRRLEGLNPNGCNWSDCIIVRGGNDPDISLIINEAQRLFNLK